MNKRVCFQAGVKAGYLVPHHRWPLGRRVFYLLMQMCPRLGSAETVKAQTTTKALLLCAACGSVSGPPPGTRRRVCSLCQERQSAPPLRQSIYPLPLYAFYANLLADPRQDGAGLKAG